MGEHVHEDRPATFAVLLHGREIERVQWDARADVEDIRRSLIQREGYHPDIHVRRSYQ